MWFPDGNARVRGEPRFGFGKFKSIVPDAKNVYGDATQARYDRDWVLGPKCERPVRCSELSVKELFEGLGYPVIELPPEACETRDAAIGFLVNYVVKSGNVPAAEAKNLIIRLTEREKRGATVLGNGLALPHLATEAVGRVIGAVGLAAKGIPWPGGFEGVPVNAVCMLLTPAAKPLETLLAEEAVVHHLFRSGAARDQAVRLRAYRYWDAAGRPMGNDHYYWYLAERDLAAVR
jgi:mannitol/fructose-specific phosphotransferase system IIA component (Ntr-type)